MSNTLHSLTISIFIECSIRLSGGEYDWEGTIYIRVKGEWGGVCKMEFDLVDARVACRQLGYSDAFSDDSSLNGFNEVTSGKYWLENLQCVGTEGKLCECPSNGIGQVSCDEFQGISVTCSCKFMCSQLDY